jgi:hypothetical protein
MSDHAVEGAEILGNDRRELVFRRLNNRVRLLDWKLLISKRLFALRAGTGFRKRVS